MLTRRHGSPRGGSGGGSEESLRGEEVDEAAVGRLCDGNAVGDGTVAGDGWQGAADLGGSEEAPGKRGSVGWGGRAGDVMQKGGRAARAAGSAGGGALEGLPLPPLPQEGALLPGRGDMGIDRQAEECEGDEGWLRRAGDGDWRGRGQGADRLYTRGSGGSTPPLSPSAAGTCSAADGGGGGGGGKDPDF